ncbi:MAG: PLP-dependent transferase [Nitrososphaerales archaeon]
MVIAAVRALHLIYGPADDSLMETDSHTEKENSTQESRKAIEPHSPPIYQTSVYDYPDLESLDDFYTGKLSGAYIYSRNGLPNSDELGKRVAAFENTESGLVCASGMGALTVALLSSLSKGDTIVASGDLYGGTSTLLRDELPRFGIQSLFVDSSDVENFGKSLDKDTKLVLD